MQHHSDGAKRFLFSAPAPQGARYTTTQPNDPTQPNNPTQPEKHDSEVGPSDCGPRLQAFASVRNLRIRVKRQDRATAASLSQSVSRVRPHLLDASPGAAKTDCSWTWCGAASIAESRRNIEPDDLRENGDVLLVEVVLGAVKKEASHNRERDALCMVGHKVVREIFSNSQYQTTL